MSHAGNQGLSLRGQAVQLLTASAHWCATAASNKLRVQASKGSACWCQKKKVVSYKLWCAVCASCVYYLARILQNCRVPCREPGAQFATAAAQFPTASAHWCSTAASGKFRTQVSKASAYRGPAVVSYKLRCATVPAACCTLLEFSQSCGVLCKEPKAQVARASCPVFDSFSAKVLNSGQRHVPMSTTFIA